ncbi:MAG TPA: OB-fold domain-containing protein [Candidatus Binataceae bacterium]|nr:OB-fold domain-containing protein [Candidatus Binataceae bacterium]
MPVTIDYSKLRIFPDPDTREWWDATRKHKYLVRRCNRCGHKWFPPTIPACGKCMSMDIGWFETAGKGAIHSYVVVVQPIVGAFVGAVPYVVAVIELADCKEEDGAVTRVAGVMTNDESEVAIGSPCEVVFEATNDPNIVMPRWHISGAAGNPWKFSE